VTGVDVLIDVGLLRAGGGDDEAHRGTASSIVVAMESIASRGGAEVRLEGSGVCREASSIAAV
jgi:hypothetical protein